VQVALLWALQNNFFDDIAVEKIVKAAASLQEFLQTSRAGVLDQILKDKKLTDASEAELKSSVEAWKSTFANA